MSKISRIQTLNTQMLSGKLVNIGYLVAVFFNPWIWFFTITPFVPWIL